MTVIMRHIDRRWYHSHRYYYTESSFRSSNGRGRKVGEAEEFCIYNSNTIDSGEF